LCRVVLNEWCFYACLQVSFKAGDTVELLEAIEGEEWWKGRINGGPEGLFPSAYVKKGLSLIVFVEKNSPSYSLNKA
jgi:hypothetical protein